MALTNAGTPAILRPEQVAALVTIPWQAASFALANTTMIAAQSPEVRLPIITDDVTAAFTPENTDIDPSDGQRQHAGSSGRCWWQHQPQPGASHRREFLRHHHT